MTRRTLRLAAACPTSWSRWVSRRRIEALASLLNRVERDRPASVTRGLVPRNRPRTPARSRARAARASGLQTSASASSGVRAWPVSAACWPSRPAHLPLREVAQAQGLGLDVEGASPEHDLACSRSGCGSHARRARRTGSTLCGKCSRSVAVPAAQLPEHGDQGVADEGVDLVDEQYQRPTDRTPTIPIARASGRSAGRTGRVCPARCSSTVRSLIVRTRTPGR